MALEAAEGCWTSLAAGRRLGCGVMGIDSEQHDGADLHYLSPRSF
jgi:hypothetical protein